MFLVPWTGHTGPLEFWVICLRHLTMQYCLVNWKNSKEMKKSGIKCKEIVLFRSCLENICQYIKIPKFGKCFTSG